MGAGRPSNTPVGGYWEFPALAASPGVSPSNAARIYTDGTSLFASINAGAYNAIDVSNTFTAPVTITTATAPALTVNANAVSGTLVQIGRSVSTTPTGNITGLLVDLNTNWTAGNTSHTGVNIKVPGTTAADAAKVGALVVNSLATLQRAVDISVTNTSGTLAFLRYDSATTLTATALVGFDMDLSTSVTASTNNPSITGLIIRIPATAAAAAAGVAALAISSTATLQRSVDVAVANTSGTIALIRWGTATTLATASTTILLLDGTTNTTAGSVAFTGIDLRIPAATAAAANGQGAIAINSDATVARVLDIDVANTSGTLAIVRYGAATTLTATALVGLDLNLSTNVTANTNNPQITGLIIRVPATTVGPAAGVAPLVISSTATLQRAIDVAVANTSGTLAIIRWGTAATLATSTATMLLLDGTTNTTAGSPAFVGVDIRVPATSAIGASGQGAITVTSAATAARVIDLSIGNTSGTVCAIYYGSGALLGGTVTGISLDLTTLSTPGANAVVGLLISIPATTAAAANAQGAIAINSDATVARVLDIDVANTSGTIAQIRWGAATSFATSSTTLFLLDGTTNTTPGSLATIGLDIRIPATTAAAANAQGAIAINSDATVARVLDIDVANTSGTLAIVRYGAATTLTATALIGMDVNLSTNVTANTNNPQITGLIIRVPATTAADAAAVAGFVISSTATAQRAIDVNVANTSAATGLIVLRYGTATTLTGATDFVLIDTSTSVTATTQKIRGIVLPLPVQNGANTSTAIALSRTGTLGSSANWTGGFIDIQNTPAMATGATENAPLININHAPTVNAGTDTTICVKIVSNPAIASGTQDAINIACNGATAGVNIRGVVIAIGSNNTGSTAAKGILLSNPTTADGVTNMAVDYTPKASAASQGLRINVFRRQTDAFVTNTDIALDVNRHANAGSGTHTSNAVCMIRERASAFDGATTLGGGIAASSGELLLINDTPSTAAAAITLTLNRALVVINHAPTAGASSTITDSTVGLFINMAPQASSATLGLSITMGSNATGAAITITNNGTGAGIDLSSGGKVKFNAGTTGAGTPQFGTNSPAITNTAPYTWLQCTASDNSAIFVPAWK